MSDIEVVRFRPLDFNTSSEITSEKSNDCISDFVFK